MNGTPHEALLNLLRGLQADRAGYAGLRGLLEAQFQGALRHDAAALLSLAEQIGAQVAELEQRRVERGELLLRLLGRAQPPSLAALLQRLPAGPGERLAGVWTELEQQIRDCKALNQRNCTLIIEQHGLMQRLLGQEGELYAQP